MWSILIQTASSYTSEKYFKQLIKDYQVAICLQLCSYLQSNLQLCRSLYTWCTEIPQLWDVEKDMWNILIQTTCSYTSEKYFKQLIKDQQVAICLQLCSYLQSNLQLCRSLYTWCTEIPQRWDVGKVMWNILIQTACSYTIGKYSRQLIKYQQLAICLYKSVLLLIVKFATLPLLVHLVYGDPTTVGCRQSHVELFDPNGLFVHF